MAGSKPKAKIPPKRKRGRPSIYSAKRADLICSKLAVGVSLRSVLKEAGMPSMSTVFEWLRRRPDFLAAYHRAKEESADALVEEILDIADDTANDFTVDDKGNMRVDHEHINRSRLRVDTRKWVASKLKPKKYGERMEVRHGGEDGSPVKVLVEYVDERAQRHPPVRPASG